MKLGTVILAKVQQADGQLKQRPMVVLQLVRPFFDFLVVALSSQLRHEFKGFDGIIGDQDQDSGAI